MATPKYTSKDLDRFWSKVTVSADPDECWEWQASCRRDGYGQQNIRNCTPQIDATHRISWRIHFGEIPDGLWVLHTCDNRKCVNPKHLFLGTRADNERDKMKKGRQPSGEQTSFHKLTYEAVKQIRETYAARLANQYELADQFGVNQSIISLIVNGKLWKGTSE